MPRRTIAFLFLAAAAAFGCVRLGIWQLHRLATRRAYNHRVSARLAEPPVMLSALPSDTAEIHFRRVQLSGTFDFAHEVLLINRVRDGAPGVEIITPFHSDAAGDSAVLVDRGWVYAPDGMTIDESHWQEPAHYSGTGFVTTLAAPRGPATVSSPGHAEEFRWLDRHIIADHAGYPIDNYLVVLQPDVGQPSSPTPTNGAAPQVPVRVPPPPLDDGPHLSYAIQWFSFAVIAVVGGIVVATRRVRDETIPLPDDVR